jgi:hypothetical protein
VLARLVRLSSFTCSRGVRILLSNVVITHSSKQLGTFCEKKSESLTLIISIITFKKSKKVICQKNPGILQQFCTNFLTAFLANSSQPYYDTQLPTRLQRIKCYFKKLTFLRQIVKLFVETKNCRKMPCNPSAVNFSDDRKVFYSFHVLHCLWKERRVLNPPLHVATVTRLERRGVAVLLCRALRLSCKSISYSTLFRCY